MWGNRSSHLLQVGMQNSTATLEGCLAVPCKTKHIITIYCAKYTTLCWVLRIYSSLTLKNNYIKHYPYCIEEETEVTRSYQSHQGVTLSSLLGQSGKGCFVKLYERLHEAMCLLTMPPAKASKLAGVKQL